jgi:hypothetical protein
MPPAAHLHFAGHGTSRIAYQYDCGRAGFGLSCRCSGCCLGAIAPLQRLSRGASMLPRWPRDSRLTRSKATPIAVVAGVKAQIVRKNHIISVSDQYVIDPEGVTVTSLTAEGPLTLTLPVAAAKTLLVGLRAATDDVHHLRQERGDPSGKAVVSADRLPLDTMGCMATVVRDGRILLQFRHAVAATTALFLSRQGAFMVAKTLLNLAGTERMVSKRER